MTEPIVGILLAAGAGRRMGFPKALIVWDDTLLVDHGVRLLREGGCDPIIVVLGAAAETVRGCAELTDVSVVVADDWRSGMGSSLARGLLAAAETDAPVAVVALVDQPFVGVEAVRRLIASGAQIAVAEYDGRPRNPVLLARRHWAAIGSAVAGTDEGARRWMRGHPDDVTGVDCTDTGSALDLDSPADLELLGTHPKP